MKLAAPPGEPLLEGSLPAMPTATRRFAVIVFFCFLAHAIVISLFGRFDSPDSLTRTEQEIPVEVIVEPAPSKEPDPAPSNKEQPANQAALDEKEATDAPRASNEKVEKEARREAPHSAKAKPEPESPESARNLDKTIPAKTAEESAQRTKSDHAEGEPLKAAERPRPEAPEQTKAEKAGPQLEKPQIAAQMPTFADAHDNALAAALRYSPVGGGNAVATYLSTVYGLVAAHMDLRKVAAGRPHTMGEIVFAIDYGGALVGAKVTKTSGLRDVDAAALAALRAASPFPLPPTGSGVTLSLRFSGK